MRIIAIANFKGGVGKTVTAVNLAAILAREGKRVVLIDADPQQNATRFLCPGSDGPTLSDVLKGTAETIWSDNLSPTHFEGLEVLPADMELLTLDLAALMSGGMEGARRMLDFLEAARGGGETDFILIDCPPGFTAASVAVLSCCDEVLLPARVDAFSRDGAIELIGQVKSLRRRNIAPGFRVLITMADRTRLSKQAEEQLRRDGLAVCRTVIHSSVCVGESSYARLPLYEYAPRSRAAQDYEALAKEVAGDG